MDERKPHKWAEVIKAWADGIPIQMKVRGSVWVDCGTRRVPPFNCEDFKFRIRPERTTVSGSVYIDKTDGYLHWDRGCMPNLNLEFDPETGKLIKAEVIG